MLTLYSITVRYCGEPLKFGKPIDYSIFFCFHFRGLIIFGVEMAPDDFRPEMGWEGDKMKTLEGIAVTEIQPTKPGEFVFSTGDKMAFETGKLEDRQVRRAADRLEHFLRYIAKNSDKKVTLPANIGDQILEQVRALNDKSYALHFYLRLGSDIISEDRLRELANPDYVYGSLWVPGTCKESYTLEELNGSNAGVSVMGAFKNADKTGYDRTLMLLSHPFDDKYPNGKISQQEAANEFLQEDASYSQIDHIDAASMYLMDYIDKVGNDKMFLAEGFMRVPLGRRAVDVDSFVGGVYSCGGRWKLGWSDGHAFGSDGVGFSMGLKD